MGLYVVSLQCERHPNNDVAIDQVLRLRGSPDFNSPLILDDRGEIVWTSVELLRERDRRIHERGQHTSLNASAVTKRQ
jgi:hypothetical protein